MTCISNIAPVAEPGMWHLRKEDDGSMEFVHRRTAIVAPLVLYKNKSICSVLPPKWASTS